MNTKGIRARYIGRDGVSGFRTGRTYVLIYEYVAGLLMLHTPKKKLTFICERDHVFKKNWRL